MMKYNVPHTLDSSSHLTTLFFLPPFFLLLLPSLLSFHPSCFSLPSSSFSPPSFLFPVLLFPPSPPLPPLPPLLLPPFPPPSSQPVCQLLKTSVEKISISVGGSVKVTQEQQTWFIESVAK